MPLGGLDARNGLKLRRDTRKSQGAKIGFAGLMEKGLRWPGRLILDKKRDLCR